jgi:hypothetical protein
MNEYELNEADNVQHQLVETLNKKLLDCLNQFRSLDFPELRKIKSDDFVLKILKKSHFKDCSKMYQFIEWYKTILQDNDDTIGQWNYGDKSIWIHTYFARIDIRICQLDDWDFEIIIS